MIPFLVVFAELLIYLFLNALAATLPAFVVELLILLIYLFALYLAYSRSLALKLFTYYDADVWLIVKGDYI